MLRLPENYRTLCKNIRVAIKDLAKIFIDIFSLTFPFAMGLG